MKLKRTPAYQKAPDLRAINRIMLDRSDREMLAPFYEQALLAHPDLKTVGIHHQPTHDPSSAEHLSGAIASFADGRHSIYIPLHGEGLETAKDITTRRPIIGEISQAWLDPYASEEQTLALAESLSFAVELGRSSLQVAHNGKLGEYYSFMDKGVHLLPFRQSSLDQMADPQNKALVADEPRYFEERFNTADWNGLAYKHYEGYRGLPRERYFENFVAYVALEVDKTLDTSQREAWGLANLRYTSDNGAPQGTS